MAEATPQAKINDDFQQLRKHAAELLDATKDDMSDRAKKARAQLTESLESAGDWLGDMGTRAKQSADRAIEEKPYYVVGGALGLGLLIGLLLGRRG